MKVGNTTGDKMAIVRIDKDSDVCVWVGARIVCDVRYTLRYVIEPSSFDEFQEAWDWAIQAKERGLRVPKRVFDQLQELGS